MITDLCNELLGRTVEEIKELNENPADYLYSYLRQSVCIASTFSSMDTLRLDLDWYGTVNPPGCRNNQKTRRDLISLETICPDSSETSSSGVAVLQKCKHSLQITMLLYKKLKLSGLICKDCSSRQQIQLSWKKQREA
jgi:hypothetical protein